MFFVTSFPFFSTIDKFGINKKKLTFFRVIPIIFIYDQGRVFQMKTNQKKQPVFSSNCEIAIHVPSLTEAEGFYANVMGFRLVARNDEVLEFDTGALRLFVNLNKEAVYSYIPSFNVSNYEAARNYLEGTGCKTIPLNPPLEGVYLSLISQACIIINSKYIAFQATVSLNANIYQANFISSSSCLRN